MKDVIHRITNIYRRWPVQPEQKTLMFWYYCLKAQAHEIRVAVEAGDSNHAVEEIADCVLVGVDALNRLGYNPTEVIISRLEKNKKKDLSARTMNYYKKLAIKGAGTLQPIPKRFWDMVKKTETCWVWTGSKFKYGYGLFTIGGKHFEAHRISWLMHNGDIPDEQCVLHKCDNPPCVRPSHLFLGDRKENNRDRDEKGRMIPLLGEQNGFAKLTYENVENIRSLKGLMSQRKIARIFNVHQKTVFNVLHHVTWNIKASAPIKLDPNRPETLPEFVTQYCEARIKEIESDDGLSPETKHMLKMKYLRILNDSADILNKMKVGQKKDFDLAAKMQDLAAKIDSADSATKSAQTASLRTRRRYPKR